MRRWLTRLIIIVPAALLLVIGTAWLWLWHSTSAAEWVWEQARLQLNKASPEAELLGTVSGTLAGDLTISAFGFRNDSIEVRAQRGVVNLDLAFSPLTIHVSRLETNGVEVIIPDSDNDPADSGADSPADLSLPYPLVIENLEIRDASIRRGAFLQAIESVQASLNWHRSLEVEVSEFTATEASGALELALGPEYPYELASEIRIDRVALPEAVREQAPWINETTDITATVSGSVENMDIRGRLEWPDWLPSGEFDGNLTLGEDLAWKFNLVVPDAELPGRWVEDTVGGALHDPADNVFLRSINVATAGGPESFSLDATTALDAPWIHSREIRFQTFGTYSEIAEWHLAGSATVSASDWPEGEVDFSAEGSGETLDVDLSAPALFGGSLLLQAETLLTDSNRFTADIEARDLSTTALLEAFEPHLDQALVDQLESINQLLEARTLTADLEAEGSMDPVSISANIVRLTTAGANRDVTAMGRIMYDPSGVSTDGLTIASGDSSARIEGRWNDDPEMKLDLSVADLGHIFPAMKGALAGSLSYRHDAQQGFANARVRANIEGEGLEIFDWRIGKLSLSEVDHQQLASSYPVLNSVESGPPLEFGIDLENIDGPLGNFPSAFALAAGRINDIAVVMQAETQETVFLAEISGKSNGQPNDAWHGTVHQLALHPAQGPSWTLKEPAGITYDDGFRAESVCLQANGETSLCIDAERTLDGEEQGHVTLASLPPDLIGPAADWPLSFTQQIDGRLSWNRGEDRPLSATVDVSISGGVVVSDEEGIELLQTGDSSLKFNIEDGSLTSGTLDIPLDSGVVDIDFSLADIIQGADSPIDGRIRVDLDNLEAVSVFVPTLAQVSGALSLDLKLAGTGGQPMLSGSAALSGGRMYVVSPGLRLSEIEIAGELDTQNQLRLDGSFRVGEGGGQIQATVDVSEPLQPTFEARLVGKNMALVNTPEIQLTANSDVEFGWTKDQTFTILGTVEVPAARFAPRYLPSDTASESPDVVLISNGKPIERKQAESTEMRIFGDLAVALGDNVVIDLELARAKATGAVMFSWRGESMPVANGEYNLRGDIQAYGQTLEITRASIRYPNVSASNPLLDVRAERTIFGNSLVTKAGVLVSGTLRRPQTEPYTIPPTNADRARALLITGSDFDYEQGVGAVNVGAYIAPKLYLSYGVGLFEEGNVFTARYELRRNFGVKATSGQDETGIDFSYTIER